MRFGPKNLLAVIAMSMIILPNISATTLDDSQWRIQVGDQISYTYAGRSCHLENVSGTIEEVVVFLQEDMYFIVEDLTGIPIPTLDGPEVSPYWINGTPFDTGDDSDLGWYTVNIHLIDQIAIRVGNWTLYAELAEEHWIPTETTSFAVRVNETSEVWNITVSAYWPEHYLIGMTSYSYSKSDGVLTYGNYTRFLGSENKSDFSLALSRLIASPILQYGLVIGIAAIAAVTVVFIISTKRRK